MQGTGIGRIVVPEQDARASEMDPVFRSEVTLYRGLTLGNGTITDFAGIDRRTRVLLYVSP